MACYGVIYDILRMCTAKIQVDLPGFYLRGIQQFAGDVQQAVGIGINVLQQLFLLIVHRSNAYIFQQFQGSCGWMTAVFSAHAK